MKLWTKTKVFSPSGLSVTIVWFDDNIWLDGFMLFRREFDAQTYILLVLNELAYYNGGWEPAHRLLNIISKRENGG